MDRSALRVPPDLGHDSDQSESYWLEKVFDCLKEEGRCLRKQRVCARMLYQLWRGKRNAAKPAPPKLDLRPIPVDDVYKLD